jgi:adenylosuccinate synthase
VGAGLGPKEVDRVVGVTKAYVTRVGSGPFPTEDRGQAGARMQERGQEVGTTTGRLRRCGWFDAVLLRYAARVNGLTELFLTKLDVLSGLPSVKVCLAYRYDGEVYEDVPPHQSIVHRAEPVYEELEGWPEELSETRDFDELPPAARKYVERLADLGGVPVSTVSVGPSREQTVEVGL